MTLPLQPSKDLIIVTEHFSPSTGATAQLISDLADRMSAHFTITVLTSTPSTLLEKHPYRVVRLTSPGRSSTSVLTKALSGLQFLLLATLWLFRKSTRSSVLLLVSNPPFIGIIGCFARLLKKTQYIYLFQDVFPRSAVLIGVLPAKGPITYLCKFFMRQVLCSSSKVIVLTKTMKNRCIKEFSLPADKFSHIDNWAVESAQRIPKTSNPLAHKWNTVSTFTVQYSGNFGRLHDMLTILEASRLLQSEQIQFVFIGAGAKRNQITEYKERFELSNLSLYPYQPRDLLSQSLGSCDISLISTIPGSEDTVAPSKFYGILASAKPVIFIGNPNSHIAQLIVEHKCGEVVSSGDPTSLAKLLLALSQDESKLSFYSSNALQLYSRNYGASSSASKYISEIRSLHKNYR